jgi:hypothetical protein
MIGEKVSRVLEQFILEDGSRNSPLGIVTICQSTEFYIPESRNINSCHMFTFCTMTYL